MPYRHAPALLLLLTLTPALADVPGLDAIHTTRVEASVTYLSSDALEGRGSGADGGRAAGDWLAAQLAESGLTPLGEDGYFQPFKVGELDCRNVIATVPGTAPGEAIVIGAHYDHLGLGHQAGSLAFGRGRGKIHNGADDNASGTAAVLEIARAFAEGDVRPRRRVIFVWFDAEERGLLGSEHFLKHPPSDDRVVLMINLDMVGRLRGGRLQINGTNTGDLLPAWIERANADVGLALDLRKTMHSSSDHAPFYRREIPVLVPFTGLHGDYHRPSDDSEDVDMEGIAAIARLCHGVAVHAANDDRPIAFSKARDGTAEMVLEQLQAMLGADRFGDRLQELRERLGLEEGDGLRELGDRLGRFLRGERGDAQPDRPRLGVRVEDGAQGVRVRSVEPGSVAERAGLRAGDTIESFAGERVADVPALQRLVAAAKGRVELSVSRDGQRQQLWADFSNEDGKQPYERWF